MVVQPGVGSGRGSLANPGEEIVVVEEGCLEFTIGEETFELESGDSLHFKAAIPHHWHNSGDIPARFLVVGNFPRGLRAKMRAHLRTGRG